MRQAQQWWCAVAKEVNSPSSSPMLYEYTDSSTITSNCNIISNKEAGYYIAQLYGTSEQSILYSDGMNLFVSGSSAPIPGNIVSAISKQPIDLDSIDVDEFIYSSE